MVRVSVRVPVNNRARIGVMFRAVAKARTSV